MKDSFKPIWDSLIICSDEHKENHIKLYKEAQKSFHAIESNYPNMYISRIIYLSIDKLLKNEMFNFDNDIDFLKEITKLMTTTENSISTLWSNYEKEEDYFKKLIIIWKITAAKRLFEVMRVCFNEVSESYNI